MFLCSEFFSFLQKTRVQERSHTSRGELWELRQGAKSKGQRGIWVKGKKGWTPSHISPAQPTVGLSLHHQDWQSFGRCGGQNLCSPVCVCVSVCVCPSVSVSVCVSAPLSVSVYV